MSTWSTTEGLPGYTPSLGLIYSGCSPRVQHVLLGEKASGEGAAETTSRSVPLVQTKTRTQCNNEMLLSHCFIAYYSTDKLLMPSIDSLLFCGNKLLLSTHVTIYASCHFSSTIRKSTLSGTFQVWLLICTDLLLDEKFCFEPSDTRFLRLEYFFPKSI